MEFLVFLKMNFLFENSNKMVVHFISNADVNLVPFAKSNQNKRCDLLENACGIFNKNK